MILKKDPPPVYLLELNQYQRDNLLWLLGCIGYMQESVPPFHLANTGAWVGEIAWMLSMNGISSVDDRPNLSREGLRNALALWLTERILEIWGSEVSV